MNQSSKWWLLAIMCISFAKVAEAQRKHSAQSDWSLVAGAGLTQFFGEINEQGLKSVYEIGAQYHFNRYWSASIDGSLGALVGIERYQFHTHFESSFHQATLTGKFNLLGGLTTRDNPHQIAVGVLTGIGLIRFHSEAYDLTTKELLRYTNSENSARNPLFKKWGTPKGDKRGIKFTNERAIPVGLWVNASLTDAIRLGMHVKYYFVRTDKLDATSGNRTVNPEEADSYSDTRNDSYSHISIHMAYRFPRKHKGGSKRK